MMTYIAAVSEMFVKCSFTEVSINLLRVFLVKLLAGSFEQSQPGLPDLLSRCLMLTVHGVVLPV